jgi:hypothetical protein
LEKLQRVASSGGGFSKCEFLRSEQPGFNPSGEQSGESGEENEQYSQHYEAIEEREDPAQSAVSTGSPHLADPSSATLTGQSNTPGELLTGEGDHGSHEDRRETEEEESDEQQYGHDLYDKEPFVGETYEDGHEHDQHYDQEYDELAENQENSETLDPFQGNNREYQQFEDGANQTAEDEGLDIYEGDHQDFSHDYDHASEEQSADQVHETSRDSHKDDPTENAFTGNDENESLAYENEGQEYLEGFDQAADHQYYDQHQETYEDSGIADGGFEEYDQGLQQASHDQAEAQYQSYEDHGRNGDLGAENIDASEIVEGEFLIDYSDTEEIPPQAEKAGHAPEQDQINSYEDDISYSDDEGAGTKKTPTKRPRADDDLETESKRLKSEAA